MAKSKTLTRDRIVELARQIEELQIDAAEVKARYTDPLDKQIREVKAELLAELKKQGLRNVSLDTGTTYSKTVRVQYEVTDSEKAFIWAQKHNALKIDGAKVTKLIKPLLEVPEGFERQETEHIGTKRGGGVEEALSEE